MKKQRRLEVARALAARPKLLLLDEPAAELTKLRLVDVPQTRLPGTGRFVILRLP